MRTFLYMILVLGLSVTALFGQFSSYSVFGNAGDQFGNSVSGAGDVNADGHDDFVVGAVAASNSSGLQSGTATVYSGADGSILYTFEGAAELASFGRSVSGAGDVNNDGFDDVIIGSPNILIPGVGRGTATVYSGADGSVLYTFMGSFDDWLGVSVSGAGDVDGDGFDDVIAGSPSFTPSGNIGSATVFSGSDGSVLYTFNGNSPDDRFGTEVSAAGDVNNDGSPDFMVTAFLTDFSGIVRVFSGADGSVLYTFNGSAGDEFGGSTSGAGDINGDGYGDFIIGASKDDNNGNNSGSATVYSGADGSVLYTFNGAAEDQFGTAVANAGDFNQDGVLDVIVGAPLADSLLVADTGSATVFSGADGSILDIYFGDDTFDWFGGSVAGAGDLNSDGVPDLLVGCEFDSDNGLFAGRAEVFLPVISAGGGQGNSLSGSLFVNGVETGFGDGPFISNITRGQFSTFDIFGAPYVLYEVYSSPVLNPGGWNFPGFGTFDLGTGPTFSDVSILLPGFSPGLFSFYQTDMNGRSQVPFYVPPSLPTGPIICVQAVVQNAPPIVNGVWGTITAAHVLVVVD